jgi:thiol-disulfide isomerase/thioredoxin
VNPQRSAIAAAFVTVIAVVAVVVALTTSRSSALKAVALPAKVASASEGVPAPELVGISHFDNTPDLTIKSLKGRVVLIDFWTYTCINCRRTFPFLRALQKTYPELTIVGVHSPEFGFEKNHDNVARAVEELDVTWPVAEDPEMATWSAYSNQYWPASYLIDRNGLVRYTHFGEGDDVQTENAVRALLNEGGTAPTTRVGELPADQVRADITPETYFGAERGERYLAGGITVPAGRTVVRHDKGAARDQVALDGKVTGFADSLELEKGAKITQKFAGKDVYATTSPAGGPVTLDVTLDGQPVPADRRGESLTVVNGRTVAVLAKQDLLHLITGPEVTNGTLQLTALSDGARFFTFTYGSS